jgi:hypothetical protein
MSIKVYRNIQELTGKGEEWLLGPDDRPIIKFVNGKLIGRFPHSSPDLTVCLPENIYDDQSFNGK